MKVLISAYACEPHKGSEPGVGWNWAKQIARFAEVWVITRANNKEVIEEELNKNPEPNLHFVYVDLPKWIRFWKKGQRGIHLYYYLWQFAAYFKAKRLVKEVKFDIAHHITFVNDWIPSSMALLKVPFVWGPIGSHPPMPWRFLPNLKSKSLEIIRINIQKIFRYFDPFFYFALFRAKIIITINDHIPNKYPFSLVAKCKFFIQQQNAVDSCLLERNKNKDNSKGIKIISVGRLIYFKGFHLALEAFALAYTQYKNISLTIIGDGMEKNNLVNLTKKLKIDDIVEFTGNISRDHVLKRMADSDIFLFPSFEGGGMVVVEAMATGLPVVCLDYGGPGEVVTDECGIKVKPITYKQTINDLAEALLKLANDPELRKRMGEAGRRRVKEHYTWEKKGEFIRKIYEEVLGYR